LGKGLGAAQRLVRDTTNNTFTLRPGGLEALGIVPGSYVVVSDTPVASNGPNSPMISTQQVVKVFAVTGDTATIEDNFAYDFTLLSPHPSNQGCCPYAQRIDAPLSNVHVTFLRFDGASNRGSRSGGVEMDFAVDSEIGHLQVSNFVQTPGPTDAIRVDTGYRNNFHDITCNSCGNGAGANGHSFMIDRQSFAAIKNITIANAASQYSFGFDAGWLNNSVVSNLIVDGGGADGRPFKLLRANHNHFDHVTAKNGGNGKNGINVTDVSTYNAFDDCVALANNGTGIMMFGNFNTHNTFNNCTAKYNTLSQFGQGKDSFGNYGDHFTSIKDGTYCCARGHSNIIQINSDDSTLRDALIQDDNGRAPYGLVIAGSRSMVKNNRFMGFAKGRDTLFSGKR
jgi:hypothetical protein